MDRRLWRAKNTAEAIEGAGVSMAGESERPRYFPRSSCFCCAKFSMTDRLGTGEVLDQLEFLPPRVEVRDFVACCFQLSFQIGNLGA